MVKSIGFVIRLQMLEFKPCEWVTLGLGQVIQLPALSAADTIKQE